MRAFKGKRFAKWATGEGLTDAVLCVAAAEAFGGQVEADLGGYLFKKRIARTGGGKSGGYRTILGFRKAKAERIFFLYGFPKNQRATITAREQTALATLAVSLVDATDGQISALIDRGAIHDLECEA
jgi:hypothetical protein